MKLIRNSGRKRMYILLSLIPILILSLFGFVCFSYFDIENYTNDLTSICIIRRAVYSTHQNIYLAALTTDTNVRKEYLKKRYENKVQADISYKALQASRHDNEFQNLLGSLMSFRENVYSINRNRLVHMLENDDFDNKLIWSELSNYSLLQSQYLQYLDKLSNTRTEKINQDYRLLLKIVLGFILIIVIMANYIVSYVYRINSSYISED